MTLLRHHMKVIIADINQKWSWLTYYQHCENMNKVLCIFKLNFKRSDHCSQNSKEPKSNDAYMPLIFYLCFCDTDKILLLQYKQIFYRQKIAVIYKKKTHYLLIAITV